MSRHYGEALAKDKLKLLAELIERAQIGQNELNEARQAAGRPKLDNKWIRGANVVKTATDYSPLLPKFLDKINDGKNVSHQEIYAAFEYIRKADDGLLAKLKITKGDEIHHAIGYAEFARSVERLPLDDQVKAFTYLSANDFPLGTVPSNTKYGALGKIAHRNPDAVGNPKHLSAHFKNNGVPLKLETIPTNFDEWVNVWENKIVPQAYTGAAVGRLVDGPRVNKIFETIEADPEGLTKIAKKHGVTTDQIVSTIFKREAIADIGDSPALAAAREYRRHSGLDNTMSNFRQGKANQGLILDQLGEAGFNPEVVQRQLQTPESIDRSILRVDPREALDNTTKIIKSRGGIRLRNLLPVAGAVFTVPTIIGNISRSAEAYKAGDINKGNLELANAGAEAVGAVIGEVPFVGDLAVESIIGSGVGDGTIGGIDQRQQEFERQQNTVAAQTANKIFSDPINELEFAAKNPQEVIKNVANNDYVQRGMKIFAGGMHYMRGLQLGI